MWGAKLYQQNRRLLRRIAKKMLRSAVDLHESEYFDQDLLEEFVWPHAQHDVVC